MADTSERFARAFGEALRRFLDQNDISVTAAAVRLGMNKQTLSSYWTDAPNGKPKKARAEVLFQACVQLGFVFEFEGGRVSAQGKGGKAGRDDRSQLELPFVRDFELSERQGTVSVSVKRPPGRVELSVSVKTAS